MKQHQSQEVIDQIWRGFLTIAIAFVTMYLPWDAMAQVNPTQMNPNEMSLTTTMCNIIGWITGPLGKAIATAFIIVIGIGALMGKVSWGMAIIVGLGVGILFGATTIVNALGGDGSQVCETGTYQNEGVGG